jgi:L-lactate dehydrogenase complex protein LldF
MQHEHQRGGPERLAYWLWKEVLRRPWLYRLALRVAGLVLRTLSRDGWLGKLPGPGSGWTAARDFPAPAKRSFRERWEELQ